MCAVRRCEHNVKLLGVQETSLIIFSELVMREIRRQLESLERTRDEQWRWTRERSSIGGMSKDARSKTHHPLLLLQRLAVTPGHKITKRSYNLSPCLRALVINDDSNPTGIIYGNRAAWTNANFENWWIKWTTKFSLLSQKINDN